MLLKPGVVLTNFVAQEQGHERVTIWLIRRWQGLYWSCLYCGHKVTSTHTLSETDLRRYWKKVGKNAD